MKVPSACWLDPRVAVRPSPIDGLGLFAAAPIDHGEIVEVLGGTILTDAQVQAMIDRGERYDGIVLGRTSSWPSIRPGRGATATTPATRTSGWGMPSPLAPAVGSLPARS
jgi:hypothetical protein